MKWTRSGKPGPLECSTGYIGLRNYICLQHIEDYEHFSYSYVENGSRIIAGYLHANGWDEAEQLVVKEIKAELSWRADYWNKLLNDFEAEVNTNEDVS